MPVSAKIKYFGWSSFGVESSQGTLYFDPFFRRVFGVSYSSITDYLDAKVICVTHGHADHTVDVPAILRKTDAVAISCPDVTNYYKTKNNVSDNQLITLNNFDKITSSGFQVTAFEWGHKEGKLSTLFKLLILNGAFFKGFGYVWMNFRETPFNATPIGFHVVTPEGIGILNYGEGFNDDIDFRQLEKNVKNFDTDILLASASLNWEEYVARGAAIISPKTVILFPPHDVPDRQLKLPTSPAEIFIEKVKEAVPNAEVIYATPGFSKIMTAGEK